MGQSIFIDSQWTDAATVETTTTAGSGAPGSNILTDRRGEFFRSSTTTTLAFANVDLGQTRSITSLAVIDVFGPTASEVKVTVYTAASEAALTAGPRDTLVNAVVVPLTVDNGRHLVYYNTTASSQRWMRVEISNADGGSTLGFGKLRVGGEVAPDPNILIGSGLVTPGSASEVTETEAGSQFVRHLYTRRMAAPQLLIHEDAYLDDFWNMLAFTGSNRPLVYAQDASLNISVQAEQIKSQQQLIYGRLPTPSGIQSQFASYSSLTLEIEEWT